MNHQNCLAVAWLLPASLGLISMGGCEVLEVSQQSHYVQQGMPLDKSLLTRIAAGKTSRQQVLATLGPPDAEVSENGKTTFTYQFDQQQSKQVRLLFLFRYQGQESIARSFYVRFKGDIVDITWFDDPSQHAEILVK